MTFDASDEISADELFDMMSIALDNLDIDMMEEVISGLDKFKYDELKFIEDEKKRKQENGEVDLFDFAEGY